MIQEVKSFELSIKHDTKIRILWKSNKIYNHFFEMGNYGLIRSGYNKKGELTMWTRMLAAPFTVNDVFIKNDETYFVIELISRSSENTTIQVKNYFQFKKHADAMNMIVTTKYLKTAFKLIINEFGKIGNYYFLKGNSAYFLEKYGTRNPIARIDKVLRFDLEKVKSKEAFHNYVREEKPNSEYSFVILLYWKRARNETSENLPLNGLFYYSHIHSHGEIIHSSEIGHRAEHVDGYDFCGYSPAACTGCLTRNREKKKFCLYKIPY